jgi:hypothetical protein
MRAGTIAFVRTALVGADLDHIWVAIAVIESDLQTKSSS